MMTENINHSLTETLWKIYHRPDPAQPWIDGSDLFWNDPAFSERILQEHLDNTHGAASRESSERVTQINWLWSTIGIKPGWHIFDVTCGPGLYAVEFARRSCKVTGIDFSPASIAYAKDLAIIEGVSKQCNFVEQDIRAMDYRGSGFDLALLLYGQLSVFPPKEAQRILSSIVQSLRPRGWLCIELLNPEHVDKSNSSWWFTDDEGLWGDSPFLHLGERFWHEDRQVAVERYQIVHLETGELTEMYLTDQCYAVETMVEMLKKAGFGSVKFYPAWGGLALADAEEWIVYLAQLA
jgi:ubiquinone/menaquinone biosynthesis C-methylase UbiE